MDKLIRLSDLKKIPIRAHDYDVEHGRLDKEQLRKTGERVSMVIPDRAQNTWTVGTN